MKKKSIIIIVSIAVVLIMAVLFATGVLKTKSMKLYNAIDKSILHPVSKLMEILDEAEKNEAGTTTNITVDINELTFNNKFVNFFVGEYLEKQIDKIDVSFKQRYNKQKEAKLYQFQASYDGVSAVDTTYVIEKECNGIYNSLYDDKYYVMDDETFVKLVGNDPVKLLGNSSLIGNKPDEVIDEISESVKLLLKFLKIDTSREKVTLPVSHNSVDCVKYSVTPSEEQWKVILNGMAEYASADLFDAFFTIHGVNKNSSELVGRIKSDVDAASRELAESNSGFVAYLNKGSLVCGVLSINGSCYRLEEYGSITERGILGFSYDGKDESKTNYLAFETDLQNKSLKGNFIYNTAYGDLLSYDFSVDLSGVSLNDFKKLNLTGCKLNAEGYFEYRNIRFNSSFETVLGLNSTDSVLKIGNVDFGVVSVDAIDVNIITSVKSDTQYPSNLERIDISGEDVSQYYGLFPGTLSFLLNIFITKPNE